jgi:RND family efflux transporter MFP subunit
MSVTHVDKPRDPLASLRIPRDQPPRRTRSGGRWLRRLAVLFVLLAVAAGAAVFAQRSEIVDLAAALQPRVEVRVGTVSVSTGRAGDAVVVASGYLESRRQAKIGARGVGRIETLNVEEGTRVKKGEVLAVLEHADMQAALAAARAMLRRAQTEVTEHEVEIARSKKEFERSERLRPSKALTETEHDTARFDYEAAVAKLESLKAAVSLAEARVRESEQTNENMFVKAPFDGTVISKDAELGESILPGGLGEGSGRGSVVTIADLDHLEVDCDVKEDYISRVVIGQPAEVSVDAVPDRRYAGKVRKIIPMGDRARATIKVKVEILDSDERLFPEMSSTVYFLPERSEAKKPAERRLFCPTDAILEEDEKDYVWLVDDKQQVQRAEVKLGNANDGQTEILGGLDGGERVVIAPPANLSGGQVVKVSE